MTCRVVIIGLGMVARLHIQAVNSLSGFQVYGLFSRDESKTQDFAKKYAKDAKIFKQFDELCDDEEVDLEPFRKIGIKTIKPFKLSNNINDS